MKRPNLPHEDDLHYMMLLQPYMLILCLYMLAQ